MHKKTYPFWDKARALLLSHPRYEFLLVTLLFALVSCALTNWTILDMDRTLFTGGVGDGTSGFLWLIFADKGWSYLHEATNLVNYPYGESIWSPIYITWTLVLGPLWLVSRFVSPIAAMNIIMLLAYTAMGVAAYYLLKRVVKDRALSFIGAYAITYVPYHIMKSIDHFTNIFAWVFVAIIGLFIAFWRRPTKKRGALLALVIAASCYTDGYYVFVSGVLILALVIASVVVELFLGSDLRALLVKVKQLVLVGFVTVVLLIPILYVQVASQKEIANDLGNARENVKLEVAFYSAKPIDFLLPVRDNVVASQFDWYAPLLSKKNTRSNDGENSNYIGYVWIALYLVALALTVRFLLDRHKSKARNVQGKDIPLPEYVMAVSLIAAPFVFIWMIQPLINVGAFDLKMPTYLLAEYIPYWRVPTRVFLAFHPLVVIAGTIALYFLLRRVSGIKRYTILAAILVVVALEFYTNIKRPSFGVDRMPSAYAWLAKQPDIKAVAELPLVDKPVEISGYAVFAQVIHQKPLVNSSLSKKGIGLFNPLGGPDNPEVINFLDDRKVDAVIIHARECIDYPWGVLRYEDKDVYSPEWIDKKARNVCVYKVNDNYDAPDSLYAYTHDGFNKTNFLNDEGKYWVALKEPRVKIGVIDSSGAPAKGQGQARFTAQLDTIGEYPRLPLRWEISQAGKKIASGDNTSSNVISLIVDSEKQVELSVVRANGQMVGENEAGLRNITITKD